MDKYTGFVQNIISEILRIKKGNVVSISAELYNCEIGSDLTNDIPLVEELALLIRKKAAFPILDITTTNLQNRFFKEIPAEIHKLSTSYYSNWVDLIDIFIEVGWQKYSDEFSTTFHDSEMNEIGQNLIEKIFDNNKKMLFLNFPNQQLAEHLNSDFKKLLDFYLDAVNCDYRYLYKQGIILKDRYFSSANYIIEDVTNVLELKINKDQALVNSGSSSENKLIVMPVGFIEFPLIRKSLNGIISAEKIYYKSHLFKNVKIMFKEGNIRFITFKEEKKENFILQNALMRSNSHCTLTLGFNPQISSHSNYALYDRAMNENITLTFSYPGDSNIYVSTYSGKIGKYSKL